MNLRSKAWMNVQNYPFSESIFKIHVIWKVEAIDAWFFVIFYLNTFIFKFIHICNPKQMSVELFDNDSWTRFEYDDPTSLNIFMTTFFNEWHKDMATANGIFKPSNDVIFWKWHHINLSLWRQTATTRTLVPTAMVPFIQATSIISLTRQLWVYYEVKRTVIKFWIC